MLNNISAIQTSMIGDLVPANELSTPVTNIAAVCLKAILEWFSQRKPEGIIDHSFRADQMRLLVLAYCFVTLYSQLGI